MSREDEFDNVITDLIEQQLLFLRGRGPEPDLSTLPPDYRAAVQEQLKIVSALADRDPESPSIEDDPVARRLGLLGSTTSLHETAPISVVDDHHVPGDDPVEVALHELAYRFNQQVTVDLVPPWASRVPAGMRPVAQCAALGEMIAVCVVTDVEAWSDTPETVAGFFRLHLDVSAVALVSADAEQSVVVTAADAQYSVDPVRGWLAPHSPAAPEPLGIALGRHIDRCLPEWERVANLDELLALGDLSTAASEISSAQIALALRAKPRLAYKKESLTTLRALDSSAIAAIVVGVQSRRFSGDELVDRVAQLAEATTP